MRKQKTFEQQDLTKLPKSVQMRLQKLERDIEYYKKLLAATEAGETDIVWKYIDLESNIPKGSTVQFSLPKGQLRFSVQDDYIEVYAPGGIRSELLVRPFSTNVIHIKLIPKPEGQ